MAKKEEPSKEDKAAQASPTAFEQMQKLGYGTYTVATTFRLTDLVNDLRPYPVAKKVDVMAIKEEEGNSVYLGLGFVGVLDEKLFLLAMRKEDLKTSVASVVTTAEEGYVGLEFFGVNRRFGSIGTVALSHAAYQNFLEIIHGLK